MLGDNHQRRPVERGGGRPKWTTSDGEGRGQPSTGRPENKIW